MKVRNLTAKTDEEFLLESINAMLVAIESDNAPMARFWAEHAVSFVMDNPKADIKFPTENA